MVDLTLTREMSFGTFAKELTGLWGPDDDLSTPKGPREGSFGAPGEGGKASRNDSFDFSLFHRVDSKELLGHALTRSKSKDCLLPPLPVPPASTAAAASTAVALKSKEPNRFTRSKSKELLVVQKSNNSTDLIRVDSLLGNASFDMSDLLGPDFMAPIIPDPTISQQQPAAAKSSQPKRPRQSSAATGSSAKKSKTSAQGSMPAMDPDDWIGKQVKLTRGKYEGRSAVVLGKTSKKYQVQVEGVAYQLEFYGTMFISPEDYRPAAPKRSRGAKKVAQQVSDRQMSFGLTASQNDISAELNR